MKRICACLLLILILVSTLSFTSCNKFIGGKNTFYNTGEYYETLVNTVSSALFSKGIYKDLSQENVDNTATISTALAINDYSFQGVKPENPKIDLTSSFKLDSDNAVAYNFDINAFGYAYEKNYVFDGYETLMSFGELIEKPYYFKSEEQAIIEELLKIYKDDEENFTYLNGEEIYKFNGKSIKSNYVELVLNSEQVSKLSFQMSELFDVNVNNLLQELYYDIKEIDYFLRDEKIHISWRRYFYDNKMCRERIKLYDNYSHYIVLDMAVSEGKDTEVEISLDGFNGEVNFDIFNLSVKYNKKANSEFICNAEMMIGDEVYIMLENQGNSETNKSQGKGEVRFVSPAGEMSIPLEYSSAERDGFSVLNVASDSYIITFNAELSIKLTNESSLISITVPDDYYRLNAVEDMSEYQYKVIPTIEAYDKNIKLCLSGQKPEEIVEPFELDIEYDDGFSNSTEGRYGKKYVDILMSDSFAYVYEFPSPEHENKMSTCKQYKLNGKEIYDYTYANGETYKMLLASPTKYEVVSNVEKIIMFEYTEEEFDKYYPEQKYFYNSSGNCVYDGRTLIYEKYFDYSSNIYTFLFNENGDPEIIIISDSNAGENLYTFVKEISTNVPTNAFDLPPYPYISATDYYE